LNFIIKHAYFISIYSQKDIANLKNEIEKRQKETNSEGDENGKSIEMNYDASANNNPQAVSS